MQIINQQDYWSKRLPKTHKRLTEKQKALAAHQRQIEQRERELAEERRARKQRQKQLEQISYINERRKAWFSRKETRPVLMFSDIEFAFKRAHPTIVWGLILSPTREKTICRARQVICWFARAYTSMSYPEIGRRLGGRDHSTVWHGRNKIAKNRSDYVDLIEPVNAVLKKMNPYWEPK